MKLHRKQELVKMRAPFVDYIRTYYEYTYKGYTVQIEKTYSVNIKPKWFFRILDFPYDTANDNYQTRNEAIGSANYEISRIMP